MRTRLRWIVVCPLAAALIACPSKKAPETPADASAPAEAAPGMAPVPPSGLALRVSTIQADGGTELAAAENGGPAFIEPTQTLIVSSNVPVSNYRIRVFDESERALVSDDTAETAPDGTLRYRIQFAEPLPPGSRFTIVIDPQTGASIQGPQGRTFDEQRLELQTTGEKPAPAPAPAPAAKPGRRRHR